jgi:hypothetical protein
MAKAIREAQPDFTAAGFVLPERIAPQELLEN